MNYIRHLTAFFDRVAIDQRLNPTHISLYIALFQFWNINRFQNPISISRSEVMLVSKIHGKATYHKVIKDLREFGFIQYKPSYNPFRGSEVVLVQLDVEQVHELNGKHTKQSKKSEQAQNSYHTKNGSSIEPMNEPYINNTNIINSKLAYEQANKNTSSDFSRARKSKKETDPTTPHQQPTTISPGGRAAAVQLPSSVSEVHTFFEAEKSTKHEAEKFYNYFQSNGWKVGGRAPMKDWRAAARNWILNSEKFITKNSSRLHATTIKNYGEPL